MRDSAAFAQTLSRRAAINRNHGPIEQVAELDFGHHQADRFDVCPE
jgi:hypothetical protein